MFCISGWFCLLGLKSIFPVYIWQGHAFLLVLACHSYCLAYFPHAYRVFYFVLVIIIDVTYSLSELLGMCYHVYSLTPPKCVVVCTLYLLYNSQ